jgi:hypothetical protein
VIISDIFVFWSSVSSALLDAAESDGVCAPTAEAARPAATVRIGILRMPFSNLLKFAQAQTQPASLSGLNRAALAVSPLQVKRTQAVVGALDTRN